MTVPPGGVLLSIAGLRGPQDHDVVIDAIRTRDPAAHIQPDWPRGLVMVQTDHTPQAIRAAVQDAGFIAAWLTHPPREVSARGVMSAIMRMVGSGFAGFIIGALAGGVAGLALMAIDPACGPGDSGGCAMGIPFLAMGAGVLGAVAGAAISLVRAVRR